ncbi:MAG TPA: hypothetical protein ENJ79_05080 [Gammaproteobacteria bacterium]|nr:hypothetical protein [Gammaproteobacteria bacterium]
MPRTLPPSGSPVTAGDLAAWLGSLARRKDPRPALEAAICRHFDVDHCLSFSTGRAAMSFLFRTLAELRQDPRRCEILMPAYTCYSVASSALMAGLEPRLCDIDPRTLSYDPETLRGVDFSRVLAITTANLYGLPDDLPAIASLARKQGVYLVDDAAQSLQARVGGRYSGTWGDAGLFSLDKGKNITAMQGGLLVTRNPQLGAALRKSYAARVRRNRDHALRETLMLLVYSLFLHPSRYWIPAGLPFLHLGETRWEENYPIEQMSPALAAIARRQLARIETITQTRQEHATAYRRRLEGLKDIACIEPVRDAEPVYLRFPVRVRNAKRREYLLAHLRRYGVTASYPACLAQVPELEGRAHRAGSGTEQACRLAQEILTLPTHAHVRTADIEHICHTLAGPGQAA